MSSELFDRASALLQNGKKGEARSLIMQILRTNPKNESAWLSLAETLETDSERIEALELCLKSSPDSQAAKQTLRLLRSQHRESEFVSRSSISSDSEMGQETVPTIGDSKPIPRTGKVTNSRARSDLGFMRSIACPKCGSSDLTEVTWNRRKCNHCGAESLLSDDRTRLELVGWQCPECGFNNEQRVTFCGKCGAALIKICPGCVSEMRLDLEFCSKCGADYERERKALYESLQQALDNGRKPEHGVKYIEAVLTLDPDHNDALCLRGQVHVNESRWRQAVADWGRVYRMTPDHPVVLRLLGGFIGQNRHLLYRRALVDARLKDEKSQRYLKAMRSERPVPPSRETSTSPPPLGKTTMGLLGEMWPAMELRMEEMHEEKVTAFQIRAQQIEEAHQVNLRVFEAECDEIEHAQSEAAEDLLTLAHMCVEALEENAERRRTQAEQARLAQPQITGTAERGDRTSPYLGSAKSAKSRATAGFLALFLGGLGIHKFYLGQPVMGILYILFCWTWIPLILGLIEAIVYFSMSDEKFQAKYG